MKCRHCNAYLTHTFIDLGFAPPSNAYLTEEDLQKAEKYYPLRVKVCEQCWLVQTEDYTKSAELFTAEYAYFSSTSKSWLKQANNYAVCMIKELPLTSSSHVIEIASNDGYLLKNFISANIPCLGIEPTDSTADAAEQLGIPVLREFFGEDLGEQLRAAGKQADLVIGNNVYAHVPDINDFTRGLKAVLKYSGTITLEFPHIMRLLEYSQFDTIYHEHFSYLSLYTVNKIFAAAGLRIWKVEELPTHGGSLRIFGCHTEDMRTTEASVHTILQEETKRGLQQLATYINFQPKAAKIKDDLLAFLLEQKRLGKTVVAYGAAAKGNTLLNFTGVKSDLLPTVYDAAEFKQNKYMPGSHIPILPPAMIEKMQPDYILILPWNIADEILDQKMALGSKATFVVAIPRLTFL